LALAFEPARVSVIIVTMCSPAISRANHFGTRKGGFAPTRAASASRSADEAGSDRDRGPVDRAVQSRKPLFMFQCQIAQFDCSVCTGRRSRTDRDGDTMRVAMARLEKKRCAADVASHHPLWPGSCWTQNQLALHAQPAQAERLSIEKVCSWRLG
jgi:hypothetical protein